MSKLTEPEILKKWSHIAMKVFPPQAEITPASADDLVICVRWKAETDPDALSKQARGVDLHFPKKMMDEYVAADAEKQLKWDAFIENAISDRLRGFDPYSDRDVKPRSETWEIGPEIQAAAA